MCSFPPSWATRPICMKGWKWNLSQGSCKVWLPMLGYMDWSPKRSLCPWGLVKYTEKGRWVGGKQEEVALDPELGPMSTRGEDIMSLIHIVPGSSRWWDTLRPLRGCKQTLQEAAVLSFCLLNIWAPGSSSQETAQQTSQVAWVLCVCQWHTCMHSRARPDT